MSYAFLDGKVSSSAGANCRKQFVVATPSSSTQLETGCGKKSKSRNLFSRRRQKHQGGATNNNVSDTNSTASFSSVDDSLASFPNNAPQNLSEARCRVGMENVENTPLCINSITDQFRRPPLPRGIRDHRPACVLPSRQSANPRVTTLAHHQPQSLSIHNGRLREERALDALVADLVRTQVCVPKQVGHRPALVYSQRPVLNMEALEEDGGRLQRHLQTIPSGEWLDSKSTSTGGEELIHTSTSSSLRSGTSPPATTGRLQYHTRIEEASTLGHEAVDCIEISVKTSFSGQNERSTGPVDIDDFIPPDSYWATEEHEIVLDEVEICRGLAGYIAGFEPEIINDLSQWNECVVEDDDDGELDEVADYRKLKRASSSAAAPNSLQSHRRCYSLPDSAAEC